MEFQTIQELVEEYVLEDNSIFLEPHEIFGKGIIGFTEDGCRVIYDLELITESMAISLKEDDIKMGCQGRVYR